ncbi:hypothetical protein HWD35_11625 [Tsukamurella tyrosinosolvens]|mgnify:FL=1|uniref:hypothetical protein n=1 Tax=Tsukamurella tyrosinosolvens TaxID=57704 RepID=UPI0007967BB0|nr:hypothetical protein [Tsukamurella tyrosinosolvens]AUN41406.1 hypothetical protein ASU32_16475 [Tsukamurella tyrosinosolvens]KXP04743.1 hypothetical protein AXK59_15280 [Tsukamurella tyrosinosolvens]KZL97996.1 hypothetical protein AXX05_03475 [Tsukamurella tyrosinosolvens]MCA4995362.1 hypothetical protein [Tsukamurella tyrosinosolvens]MEC4611670.1 hypothetical protein [Tsukamurella tyrosinosolvens]
MLRKSLVTGIAAAGLVAGIAAPAQAAPLAVPQVPLTATQVAGLGIPQPFTTRIGADTTGRPGEVRLAAHSSVGYNSYMSLVRIDFRNLRTGARGSVTVKPFTLGQVPNTAVAQTGTGRVAYTARFVSSGTVAVVLAPTPGSGSFDVR